MSDMTSLSQEYSANADFAEELNDAVIRIKKADMGSAVRVASAKPLKEVQSQLAQVLQEFLYQLSGKPEQRAKRGR